MEKVSILTIPMQVEVVGVERASRCNFLVFEILQKSTIYIKCLSKTGAFFCSFESCGQYVKKSGRIILVAFPAT
jgi:antirestriction protein